MRIIILLLRVPFFISETLFEILTSNRILTAVERTNSELLPQTASPLVFCCSWPHSATASLRVSGMLRDASFAL